MEWIAGTQLAQNDFQRLFQIMEASFPTTEYRTYEGLLAAMAHPAFHVLLERQEGEVAAFLTAWELGAFRFVENFAVSERLRGAGMGGKMLQEFLKLSNLSAVLEVEPPDHEIAQRRIAFYKRAGFHLCDFPYVQPPLRQGNPPVPLQMMSWPNALLPDAFESLKRKLYSTVYQTGIY